MKDPDPPAPVIPLELVDSLLRTGFKDLSIQRHREEDSRDPAQAIEVAAQKKDLLDTLTTNLNNDFAHECLDIAVLRLGASHLPRTEQDIGTQVFAIPGIPQGRFLPHQVCGIWFLVDRVIGNCPPRALLADDMGLGKVFTALGALFDLKWILAEAASGQRLACLEDQTVEELGDAVPPFFDPENEVFHRPSLVVAPASLLEQWEEAINKLLKGTKARLINLNVSSNRWLGPESLNYLREIPERGMAIHLISYETFRIRAYGSTLSNCAWGVGIFDESHTVRRPGTLGYRVLCNANVGGKFQLTGTPMYTDHNSWVTQTEWLFAGIDRRVYGRQPAEILAEILEADKSGTIDKDEAYAALKNAAYPWMIRRWAETEGPDGKPLVDLRQHVIEDVRLTYTKAELERLNSYISKLKADKSDHVSTIVHEYRQACLSLSLAENDYSQEGLLRQAWDRKNYHAGPAIRWLGKKFVPILLGEPADGLPNKAIIFTPLPGEASFVNWYLQSFHKELKSFLFHAGLTQQQRTTMIAEFSAVESPAALVITPPLGATGLNLVAANHVVILQKFWTLNEQRQAIGRIHRLGQKREPTAWIVHCKDSIDDRSEELHKSRAMYEARIMHGLIGESFSYTDLVSACKARLQQQQQQAAEFLEIANIQAFPDSPKATESASREKTPQASDG